MRTRISEEEARVRQRGFRKKWYLKNRESAKAKHLERLATDPEYKARVNGYRAKWSERNPEKVKAHSRKSNWKIHGCPEPTRPEPTHCECCGNLPGNRAMHLDHCHVTGAFRGWLCTKCNSGIGMLGDNSDGIEKASAYLARSKQ